MFHVSLWYRIHQDTPGSPVEIKSVGDQIRWIYSDSQSQSLQEDHSVHSVGVYRNRNEAISIKLRRKTSLNVPSIPGDDLSQRSLKWRLRVDEDVNVKHILNVQHIKSRLTLLVYIHMSPQNNHMWCILMHLSLHLFNFLTYQSALFYTRWLITFDKKTAHKGNVFVCFSFFRERGTNASPQWAYSSFKCHEAQ